MSGVLKVNHGSTWLPANWVFDFVVSRAAEQLAAHPELAKMFAEAGAGESLRFLDLQALRPDELRTIAAAVSRVLETTRRDGPEALSDPTFFSGLVARQQDLLEKLQGDPRCAAKD